MRGTNTNAAAAASMPSIPKEPIDQFVTGSTSADAVPDLSTARKKALIEHILGAELSLHLGHALGAARPKDAGNHRNGTTDKTALTDCGPLRIEAPRDQEGRVAPLLIRKHEWCPIGFHEKIVAMYAPWNDDA